MSNQPQTAAFVTSDDKCSQCGAKLANAETARLNWQEEAHRLSKSGMQVAIDYMVGHYWGHEIIRAAVYHLCATNGLPMPKVPFAPERLHPGATRAEDPPKAVEVPLQGKSPEPAERMKDYVPERVWTMDPLGPEASQPLAHPNPKTSSPPPSPAPYPLRPAVGYPACADPPERAAAPAWEGTLPKAPEPPISEPMTVKERLDFHSEFLVTLEERLKAIEQHLALDAKPPALERIVYSERRLDSLHCQLRELQRQCFERLESLEKWKTQNQEVYEKLAKQNAALIDSLSHSSFVAPQFDSVLGLQAGKEVDEVRFLTVKWQGTHWLLLHLRP